METEEEYPVLQRATSHLGDLLELDYTHPGGQVVPLALFLLSILLYYEACESRSWVKLSAKIPLSLLFCYVGYTSYLLTQEADVDALYYRKIVCFGLVLGLVGDIFLAIDAKSCFVLGLISFLLGHLMYVVAFAFLVEISPVTVMQQVVDPMVMALQCILVVSSIIIFVGLSPYLGDLKPYVVVYIFVITCMVGAAIYVFFDAHYFWEGRLFILVGSISFYISDIFVASNKFLGRSFMNRAFTLPAYYFGQFLIAFSIAMLHDGVNY
tara:strand:- start:401 stop:1201 length:801 start_codon:yes stop_codon:yes gene_type:complete